MASGSGKICGKNMSRPLFRAIHRQTGASWQPENNDTQKQWLMLYDSGYLAVVTESHWHCFVEPLDPKAWKIQWDRTAPANKRLWRRERPSLKFRRR